MDCDVAVVPDSTDGATVESDVEAVRDDEIDVRNDCDSVDIDDRCAWLSDNRHVVAVDDTPPPPPPPAAALA